MIKKTDLRPVLDCQKFNELRINSLINYADKHIGRSAFRQYLPCHDRFNEMPKKFLLNIINTLKPGCMERIIKNARKMRRDQVNSKKRRVIKVIPELEQLFNDAVLCNGAMPALVSRLAPQKRR